MDDNLLLMYLYMALLEEDAKRGGGSQAAQAQSQSESLKGAAKTGKAIYGLYKEAMGALGGGEAASTAYSSLPAATQASLNAMGPASQAAWNAGALGASTTSTAGSQAASQAVLGTGYQTAQPAFMNFTPAGGAASGWSTSGIGSAGNYYLPALGAVGTFDLFKNQRTGKRGYLQGAASGAALGSYFGPWGTLIGAGGGLGMGAASEYFDTNRFKTEGNRLSDLQKKGVNIPREFQLPMNLKQGRSRDELVAIEEAKKARGEWNNVDFAKTRDKKYLKPEDIWAYSAFFDKYGNDWLGKFSEQQRRSIAQKALDRGAVNEHHGTIDIAWTPDLEKEISGLINPAGATATPPPANGTQQTFPKSPTMIPRTGRAAPGYRPGPRR